MSITLHITPHTHRAHVYSTFPIFLDFPHHIQIARLLHVFQVGDWVAMLRNYMNEDEFIPFSKLHKI